MPKSPPKRGQQISTFKIPHHVKTSLPISTSKNLASSSDIRIQKHSQISAHLSPVTPTDTHIQGATGGEEARLEEMSRQEVNFGEVVEKGLGIDMYSHRLAAGVRQ